MPPMSGLPSLVRGSNGWACAQGCVLRNAELRIEAGLKDQLPVAGAGARSAPCGNLLLFLALLALEAGLLLLLLFNKLWVRARRGRW